MVGAGGNVEELWKKDGDLEVLLKEAEIIESQEISTVLSQDDSLLELFFDEQANKFQLNPLDNQTTLTKALLDTSKYA